MSTDLTPAMMKSVQRLAGSARMAGIAANMEELARGDGAINFDDFKTAYYPLSFVTGDSVSVSVLQWLFPSASPMAEPSNVVDSPLGELSQICLITDGLLRYVSAGAYHEALDVLLSTRAFLGDGEAVANARQQQALDDAVRYARDGDTIDMLIAHGADPQALKRGFLRLPITSVRALNSIHRIYIAPVYAEIGVFLVGDDVLLPSHLQEFCSLDTARGLLCAGVDPATVLHAAAKNARDDVLRAMNEIAYLDIDSRTPEEDGMTALLQVVANRNAPMKSRVKTVRTLIDLGARVNARGPNSETPLSQAIDQKNHQLIELLLSCGSDADLLNDEGSTSLHIVCRDTSLHPCLEHVLKSGANPNLLDGDGRSPLDILVSHHEHQRLYQAIELLVSFGGDIDFHEDPTQSPRAALERDADGRNVLRQLRLRGLIKAFPWSDEAR